MILQILDVLKQFGVGSLLLTDKKDQMEKLFGPSDIVGFENVNDCIEKIKFYLKNDEAREKIAKNGYKKTHLFHLLDHRNKIIDNVLKKLINEKEVITQKDDYIISYDQFKKDLYHMILCFFFNIVL